MIWNIPPIWKDGEVWILGGGPSIPEQFGIPNEVVQDVLNGSSTPEVYSPYMSEIHKKHVIGINVSYLIGDWIDMVFFGDTSFYLPRVNSLAEFSGLKVSCHPRVEKYDWIKYVPRDRERPFGISNNKKTLCWNGNSGAAAISLAVHLGAKRIILLGFDMRLDSSNKQHWHDQYGRLKNMDKKRFVLPFDRHLKCFPFIAEDAKRLGVEIINASPESMIKQFPKVHLKELL